MRYLYKISDGKLLDYLGVIIKTPSKPDLFNQSYEILNEIDEQKVNDINNELLKLNISTNEEYNQNKPIRFTEISGKQEIDYNFYKRFNAVRLNFNIKDILSNKSISEFIIQNDFSSKIEKLIGAKTYLAGIESWITLPVPEIKKNYEEMTKYQETQRWHRDVDHLRDLKIFIYLNDVLEEDDGPFEIIQGSNCTEGFNQRNYIDKIKFRISNEFAIKKYKNCVKTIYGKKGTTFLADTRAFHRGKIIMKKKYRIILMLYYTTHLFGNNKKIDLERNFESYEIWSNQIKKNKYISLFNI